MHPTEPFTARIRALIVDDEAPGRDNLRALLAPHAHWEVAGVCASVAEARAAMAQGAVDVVFLDIRMPRESGLGLARSLCEQAEPPLVIFVTAHDAYAVDAFDVHALDYLLKPVGAARMTQALERVEQLLAQRQRGAYGEALRAYVHAQAARDGGAPRGHVQRLTVRSVGKVEAVALDDVHWIGAASNYVELHMSARTVLHRQPLSRLEADLDPAQFLRVHRRTIVRIAQIAALRVVGDGSYALRLRCGAEVMVSERHVQAVREKIGLFSR